MRRGAHGVCRVTFQKNIREPLGAQLFVAREGEQTSMPARVGDTSSSAAVLGKRGRGAGGDAGSANLTTRRGRSAHQQQAAGQGPRARRTASSAPETSASAVDVTNGAEAILALSRAPQGSPAASSNQPSPSGRPAPARACSPLIGRWASSRSSDRTHVATTEAQALLPASTDTRGAASAEVRV